MCHGKGTVASWKHESPGVSHRSLQCRRMLWESDTEGCDTGWVFGVSCGRCCEDGMERGQVIRDTCSCGPDVVHDNRIHCESAVGMEENLTSLSLAIYGRRGRCAGGGGSVESWSSGIQCFLPLITTFSINVVTSWE